MRLSNQHKEIAKLMAKGLPNREIKKHMQISDSRLSVLRANKLMQREIAHYRELEESKYAGAIEVFKKDASKVAEKLVNMVVSEPNIKDSLRLKTAESILDRLAEAEGVKNDSSSASAAQAQNSMSFEQILRVSQTSSDTGTDTDETSAFLELEEDLADASDTEPDTIDVTPISYARLAEPRAPQEDLTEHAAKHATQTNHPKSNFSISPELASVLGRSANG